MKIKNVLAVIDFWRGGKRNLYDKKQLIQIVKKTKIIENALPCRFIFISELSGKLFNCLIFFFNFSLLLFLNV
jgi:hypothetical protein